MHRSGGPGRRAGLKEGNLVLKQGANIKFNERKYRT